MTNNGLFAVHGEDGAHHLGVICSTSEAALRTFGVAYMRDPATVGSLTLHDPTGQLVATFEARAVDWEEASIKAM